MNIRPPTLNDPPVIDPPAHQIARSARPRRSRLLLAGAVMVLLLAAVAALIRSHATDAPAAAPNASTPSASAAGRTGGSPGTSQPANACLGGTANLNDAVIYAQEHAELNGRGAAELIATIQRWRAAVATTPSQFDPTIPARLLASNADETAVQSLNTPRLLGDSVSATYDATKGSYLIASESPTAAEVWVLGNVYGRTRSGADRGEAAWGRYHLTAVEGHWTLQSQSGTEADRAKIMVDGMPFQGSC